MLEIAQHVQQFLHKHDRPHVSLYEEMLQRQRQKEEEEKKRLAAEWEAWRIREEEEVCMSVCHSPLYTISPPPHIPHPFHPTPSPSHLTHSTSELRKRLCERRRSYERESSNTQMRRRKTTLRYDLYYHITLKITMSEPYMIVDLVVLLEFNQSKGCIQHSLFNLKLKYPV